MKIWQIKSGSADEITFLEDLQAALCQQRGIESSQADAFLNPDFVRDIHNPYLLTGMEPAVERIYRAVQRGERIVVFGDYDVDGVSATAILVTVLRELGGEVIPYLPHRNDDGYGLNHEVLQRLLPEFDLLISVDCGISNREEVAWLKQKGKDAIVVDHHEIPDELPPAFAILHPRHPEGNYPFPYLSGAGVAWKLAQALLRNKDGSKRADEDDEKWLLDLTVLGTVADMVPLTGENRAIVRFGLEVLRRTKRAGLRVLLRQASLEAAALTTDTLSFRVIPMLNAAGRMDHAQPALDLLLAPGEQQAAEIIARLHQYNQDRRASARRVMREAEQLVAPDSPMIFAANITWPAGVLGLAAGRLAEKFSRPAVVVGGNGRHAVGSARAPEGMNVLEVLQAGASHALKLGGHARAAGFSVEAKNMTAFQSAIMSYARERGAAVDPDVSKLAEAVVSSRLLDWNTFDLLQGFEPFGQGNSRPTLVARRLPVVEKRAVGKTKEHAKLTFGIEERTLDGIGFGLAGELAQIGRYADVLFCLEVNEFRGRTSLQLMVKDVAPAGSVAIKT